LGDKKNIKKLEKIIHPLVRKKMKKFTSKNKYKKSIFKKFKKRFKLENFAESRA